MYGYPEPGTEETATAQLAHGNLPKTGHFPLIQPFCASALTAVGELGNRPSEVTPRLAPAEGELGAEPGLR
jgi:hypothetical protein